MEQTQQIEELNHKHSLKQQECQELTLQLAQTESDNKIHRHHLEAQIKQLTDSKAEQELIISNLTQELVSKQKQIDQLSEESIVNKEKVLTLTEKANNQKEELGARQDRITQLQAEITKLEEELKETKREHLNVAFQSEDASSKLRRYEGLFETEKKRSEELQKEINQKFEEIGVLQNTIQSKDQSFGELQNQNSLMKLQTMEEKGGLAQEINKLQASESSLKNTIDKLHVEMNSLNELKKLQSEEISFLKQKSSDMQLEMQNYRLKMNALETESRMQNQQLEFQLKAAVDRAAELENYSQKLKAKVATRKSENENISQENSVLKEKLACMNERANSQLEEISLLLQRIDKQKLEVSIGEEEIKALRTKNSGFLLEIEEKSYQFESEKRKVELGESELESLKQKLRDNSNECDLLKGSMVQKDFKIDELEKALLIAKQDYHQEKEILNREVDNLKAKMISQTTLTNETIEIKLAQLTKLSQEQTEEIQNLNQERDRYFKKSEELEQELELFKVESKQHVNELESQVENLDTKFKEAEQNYAEAKSRLALKNDENNKLSHEIGNLYEKIAALSGSINNQQDELDTRRIQVEKLRSENLELEEKLQELKNSNSELTMQINEVNLKYESQRRVAESFKNELETTQSDFLRKREEILFLSDQKDQKIRELEAEIYRIKQEFANSSSNLESELKKLGVQFQDEAEANKRKTLELAEAKQASSINIEKLKNLEQTTETFVKENKELQLKLEIAESTNKLKVQQLEDLLQETNTQTQKRLKEMKEKLLEKENEIENINEERAGLKEKTSALAERDKNQQEELSRQRERIEEYQKETAQLEDRLRESRDGNFRLTAQVEELSSLSEKNKRLLDESQDALSRSQQESSMHKAQLGTLEALIRDKDAQIKTLESSYSALQLDQAQQILNLNEEVKKVKDNILQETVRQAEKESAIIIQQREIADQNHNELNRKYQELQEEVQELNLKLKTAQSMNEVQQQQLESQIKHALELKNTAENQLNLANAELASRASIIEKITQEAVSLRERGSFLSEKIENFQAELKSYQSRAKEQQTEIFSLEEKVKEAKQANATLQVHVEERTLKAQMQLKSSELEKLELESCKEQLVKKEEILAAQRSTMSQMDLQIRELERQNAYLEIEGLKQKGELTEEIKNLKSEISLGGAQQEMEKKNLMLQIDQIREEKVKQGVLIESLNEKILKLAKGCDEQKLMISQAEIEKNNQSLKLEGANTEKEQLLKTLSACEVELESLKKFYETKAVEANELNQKMLSFNESMAQSQNQLEEKENLILILQNKVKDFERGLEESIEKEKHHKIQINELVSQNEALLTTVESERQEARSSLQTQVEKINFLHEEVETLKGLISMEESKIKELQEESTSNRLELISQQANIIEEIKRFKSELVIGTQTQTQEALVKQIEEQKTLNHQLQQQTDMLRDRLNTLLEDSIELKTKVAVAESEKEAQRQIYEIQIKQACDIKLELEQEIKALELENRTKGDENQKIVLKISKYQQENASLNDMLAKIQEELKTTQQSLQDQHAMAGNLQKKMQEYEKMSIELSGRIEGYTQKIEAGQSQIKALEEQVKHKEEDVHTLKIAGKDKESRIEELLKEQDLNKTKSLENEKILNDEIKSLQDKLTSELELQANQSGMIDELKRTNVELLAQLGSYRLQVTEMKQINEELAKKVSSLASEYESQKAELEGQIQQAANQKQELEVKLVLLQTQLTAKTNDYESVSQQAESFKEKIAELERNLSTQQEDLNVHQERLTQCQREISNLKQGLRESEEKNKCLLDQIGELATKNENLERLMESKHKEIEQLEKHVLQKDNEILSQKQILDQVQTRIQELEKETYSTKLQVIDQQSNLVEQIKSLKSDLLGEVQLNAKLESLTQQVNALEIKNSEQAQQIEELSRQHSLKQEECQELSLRIAQTESDNKIHRHQMDAQIKELTDIKFAQDSRISALTQEFALKQKENEKLSEDAVLNKEKVLALTERVSNQQEELEVRQNRIAQLQAAVTKLEEELREAKTESLNISFQAKDASSKLARYKGLFESEKKRNDELQKELAEKSEDIAHKNDMLNNRDQKIVEQQKQNVTMKLTNMQEKGQVTQEINRLQASEALLKSDLDRALEEIKSLRDLNKDQSQQISSLNQNSTALQSEIQSYRLKADTLDSKNSLHNQQLEAQTKEIAEKKGEIERLSQENSALKEKISYLGERTNNQQEELNIHQQKIEEQRRDISKMEDEAKELKAKHALAISQLEEAVRQMKNAETLTHEEVEREVSALKVQFEKEKSKSAAEVQSLQGKLANELELSSKQVTIIDSLTKANQQQLSQLESNQSQIARLLQTSEELTKKVSSIETQKLDFELQLKRAEASKDQLEEQLSQVKSQLLTKGTEYGDLSLQCASLKENVALLSEKVNNQQDELNWRQQRLSEHQDEISRLEQNLREYKDKNTSLSLQINELIFKSEASKRALEVEREETQHLEKLIKQKNEELLSQKDLLSEHQTKIEELEKQHASIRVGLIEQQSSSSEEIRRLKADISIEIDKSNRLTLTNQEHENNMTELQKTIDDLRKKLLENEHQSALRETQVQIQTNFHSEELAKLKAELQIKEESLRKLEKNLKESEEQLDTAQKSFLELRFSTQKPNSVRTGHKIFKASIFSKRNSTESQYSNPEKEKEPEENSKNNEIADYTYKYALLSNGEKIAYIEDGPAEAKYALIALHTNATTSHVYLDFMARMRDFIRVIAIDLRGHGRSSYVSRYTKVEDLSGDLHQFITELGLKTVSLVGWSLGGGVCLKYSMDHPEMVNKVILHATMGIKGWSTEDETFSAEDLLENPGIEMFFEQVADNNIEFIEETYQPFKELLGQERFMEFCGDVLKEKALQDSFYVIGGMDLSNSVAKLEAKVLIIHGINDEVCPVKIAEETAKILGDKVLLDIWDGIGHMMLAEAPARVASTVKKFLLEGKI